MSNPRTALLCLLGAVSLLHTTDSAKTTPQGRTSLSNSNQQEPCTLPHGYSRFHANDSFIGRPVPCTKDDKICFGYNLLFNPKFERCEPLGLERYSVCQLRTNKTEFEHGSGRIIGVCGEYQDPCPGYRMAYDYRCYPKEIVSDVICGRCTQPTTHLFGGTECGIARGTQINVQQPKEQSRCLIPDLRFPDLERSIFFNNPLTSIQGFRVDRTGVSFKDRTPSLTCESQQAKCFSQGRVWLSEYKGCHVLLEQGPCPAEHVVALDSQAAFQGRAVVTCVHVRGGCPLGHKRMLFDGQCHEDRELKVGAPGETVWNQYGQYVMNPHGYEMFFRPTLNNGFCEVNAFTGRRDFGSYAATSFVPKPYCGADNSRQCRLYEVESEIPKPEGK